ERSGRAVHQPVAAPGELEHVARCGAQTKRGAVDQAELATLLRGHRATLALVQCFREEENGGEGRAQVVRELYDEVEPVWAGQAGGQILRLLRRLRLRSGRRDRRHDRPVEPFSGVRPHLHHPSAYHAACPPDSPAWASTGISCIGPAPGSRSTTQPAVGLRCRPWRSLSRYNVVRSTPAMWAAFDMLPPARLTSQVRYCRSNCAMTRSRAA